MTAEDLPISNIDTRTALGAINNPVNTSKKSPAPSSDALVMHHSAAGAATLNPEFVL